MKQKLVPVISILVGVLAFLLARQYIAAREKALKEAIARVESRAQSAIVVGAAENLPKGSTIKQSDLARVNVDRRVSAKAVSLDDAAALIGRRLQVSIRKAEPIFWSDVEGGAETGPTLAPIIQKTLRAISIPASGASAVSGLIQPNDRVDILGTFTLPSKTNGSESETVTLTVLQDVTVLATGQKLAKTADTRGGGSGYSMITVEVTPREAELLVFAQQMQGRLTLTLRNPSDGSYEPQLPNIDFEQIEKTLPELNNIRQTKIRHNKPL